MRQWMKVRTARAVILLFGLSLALTACNVENVLALLADLSPPAAETADDGAAADEDAASDEQADASEPAESSEQPGAGEASEAEGTADSADDEPCINRNEHVANLREPETRPTHRARQRTERRRDADQPDEEPSADEDESEDEQAEQPSERRRERPRDRANPPASEEPAGGGGQSGGLSGIEQQVFDLLNAERQQAGLDALQLDSTLSQGSRAWSRRMATEGFFAHDTGGNFAENIAYGYPSAEAVHRGWMESEGHRNNRMNSRYTSYGVGVFEQDGTIYYTERFR